MGYRLHIHGMGASKKVLEERICTVPRDSVLISGKFTHSVLENAVTCHAYATETLRKLITSTGANIALRGGTAVRCHHAKRIGKTECFWVMLSKQGCQNTRATFACGSWSAHPSANMLRPTS